MRSIEVGSGWGQAAGIPGQGAGLDLPEKILRKDATLTGSSLISPTVSLFSSTFKNKHAELQESSKLYLCT